MITNFSVLLSVYHKENPVYLEKSLESIWTNQTLKPSEIVLVKDGPLTQQLDDVISSFQMRSPQIFNIIALPENRGLGNALKIGGNECKYEYIARMDTDDIAFPDRFEKQMSYMLENNLDIVGGQIIEFGRDTNDIISERIVPVLHHKIVKSLKTRSPFSHPTVIFRKEVFEELNGYDSDIFPEDYDFFVRAYLKGYKFGNVKDKVLWFRLGKDKSQAIKRRWGREYAKKELKLYRRFMELGFYDKCDFLKVVLFKLPLRIIPFPVFKFLYFNVFRK